MTLIEIPSIVEPLVWNVVFNRDATSWIGRLVPGRFRHVRAYAYVPGFHIWIFYDVHLLGTDITIAADGEPALHAIGEWLGPPGRSEVIAMRRLPDRPRWPVSNWCVPAMGHLLRLRTGALRPDALRRHLLRNGGIPFESEPSGKTAQIPAAAARPDLQRAAATGPAGSA